MQVFSVFLLIIKMMPLIERKMLKQITNFQFTVNWGDFGHFSNSTSCISLLLLGMPLVLPGKLESQFLLKKNCGILGLKMFQRPLKCKK